MAPTGCALSTCILPSNLCTGMFATHERRGAHWKASTSFITSLQQSVSASQQIQLHANVSTLQSLDYAGAITTLTQQNTTLSAALQAYSLTQGLSLFKYL